MKTAFVLRKHREQSLSAMKMAVGTVGNRKMRLERELEWSGRNEEPERPQNYDICRLLATFFVHRGRYFT